MKYFLPFVFSFGAWLIILLAFDLHASTPKIVEKTLVFAIMTSIAFHFFYKPAKRLYRRTFSKAYRYNKPKPIVKDRTKELQDS